jgi:3-methylfumaryl-CoA hydratase
VNSWEGWIGRSRCTSAVLDPAQANRMAVTLDREPTFSGGDELPPGWHWLFFHDLVRASRLGGDGHPAPGEIMPPVSLPRRMWAGGELRFVTPVRLGVTATRTSTITDIVRKDGRTGSLCFVTVDHAMDVDGHLALSETQTIVYRDMSTGAATSEGPAAPDDPQLTEAWELDSSALFRYSALTFNGHRIHYDADYARSVEGYPGVVVHGPLLATLLMDLALRQRASIRTFRYRARSPLTLPDAFTLNSRPNGDLASLWVASADGRLATSAEVEWHPLEVLQSEHPNHEREVRP